MRVLMKVQLPTEAGNRAIKDGTLPDIIRRTLETVQAEAAYFDHGRSKDNDRSI
jgi:hypothetical protein